MMEVCPWEKSSEALEVLENTLRCSFCKHLLQDPCTLGNCDHLFCRACIKEFVDAESCPSCEAPAWARDVQVNRELAGVVQLFRKLRKIISARPDIPARNGSTEEEDPESLIPQIDLSHLNDNDDDQEKGDGVLVAMDTVTLDTESQEHPVPEENRVGMKRKALHDQNARVASRSQRGRKVKAGLAAEKESSISSRKKPALIVEDENDPYAIYESASSPRQEKKSRSSGGPKGRGTGSVLQRKTVGSRRTKKALRQKLEKANNFWNKMGKPDVGKDAPEGGSRKVNFSDYDSDRESGVVVDCSELAEGSTSETPSQDSGLGRRVRGRRPAEASADSRRKDVVSPRRGDEPAFNEDGSGSGAVKPCPVKGIMKRNIRGESPLHLACIKGDLDLAHDLLQKGSDPNMKDHAGWTPLHEACNHGFVEIVAALLDHGALINVPGCDNDSPLHDAVNNNRPDVVKLLIERGASLEVRNIHGQRPGDLPASKAVIKALKTKQGIVADLNSSFSSLTSTPVSQQKVVLLGTGLSEKQRGRLQSCARLLKGKVSSDFTQDVTHLVTNVVTEGRCSRTMKFLQAVLLGKWVVNFSWVEDCLQTKGQVAEVNHEICGTTIDSDSEGAKKSREMANSQFPPLFDGCQFYLHGNFSLPTPPREELASLLKLGGGSILARCPKPDDDIIQATQIVPYHAKPDSDLASCSFYIVYDHRSKRKPPARVRTAKLCTVPVSWVMDCISHYELLDLPE